MEKLLFLYLKTGGGHISSARSVANYIEQNHLDKKIILSDGFEKTNPVVKFIIEDGYRISQARAKWAFEFSYALSKIPFISKIIANMVSLFVEKHIKDLIINELPQKIVIFHFFLSKPVIKVLKELKLKIPVVTVVTDPFTVPPIWLLNKEQKFVVFSQKAKNETVNYNIAQDKVNVFNYIIDPKYNIQLSENEIVSLKEKLGFNKENKIILIIGGGDGIQRGKQIVKEILTHKANYQLAIVCGKNKTLLSEANKLQEKHKDKIIKVFGFVNFVYDLINISDIVITKGGPATIMEILMLKKIPVINNYLWEQEKGNVEFVYQNHLGFYEKNVKKLPKIISEIVDNKEVYNLYKNNIEKMGLKNGTAEVSNFILNVDVN